MGLRSSREVSPLLLPQFYNLTDSDKGYEQAKHVPSSIEYAIIRTLLNLEKIQQLLNLKDIIKDPLNSSQIKGTPCVDFLEDLLKIHEKYQQPDGQTFHHDSLHNLAEKAKGFTKQPGAKGNFDPVIQILTLLHYSTSCLSLLNLEGEDAKGKDLQNVVNSINLSRIDPFDRVALLEHLYSDLFSLKKLTTIKENPSEKLDDLKMVLNSGNLDFLNDPTKIPTFYHNAIKHILFSSSAVSSESELGKLASMYKSALLNQLKKKHYDLELVSPLMICTDQLISRYFHLGFNCSFGVLNLGKNYIANVKPCIVHVSYDGEHNKSLRMTYTASVALKNKKGTQIAEDETQRLRTTTEDLANKLASYHSDKDYKNDYGYVIVVEKQGSMFYTTSKDVPLERILDGTPSSTIRFYFVPLNKLPQFNGPTSSLPYITRVLNRDQERQMEQLAVSEITNTIDSMLTSAASFFKVERTAIKDAFLASGLSKHGMRVKIQNHHHSRSIPQVREEMKGRAQDDVFVDPSLKPLELILELDFGASDKINNIESKWSQCQNSRYHLKPDCSRVLDLLIKYSLNWETSSQSSPLQETSLRCLLPSVLILPLQEMNRFFEVYRKVSLPFAKDLCKQRRLQLSGEYNVVAYIAHNTLDESSGYYYDIYRKSLDNTNVHAFFDYEVKKLWDIQNPLLDLSEQDQRDPVIIQEGKIEDLNFSKVKYVILQQTL